MLIRMPAKGISVIGRNTQGVRLITLESKEEQVVGAARVAETTAEAEAAGVREEPEGQAPVETAPEDAGEGEGGEGGPPEAQG
jgi:DNA gyrase subunit A